MFNKQTYLIKKQWLKNRHLVTPYGSTATKICKCCDTNLFTTEFIDCPEIEDGKLPVCIDCLRSKKNGNIARSIVDDTGLTQKCGKCAGEKGLGQFVISFSRNSVSNKCLECETEKLNKIFQKE